MARVEPRLARRLSIVAFALAHGALLSAQARTDAGSLSRMPRPVREEVDRLVSDEAGKRATAAASLGEMGGNAIDALPWLVAVVQDARRVMSLTRGNTEVGSIAAEAIGKMGTPATVKLLALLNGPDTSPEARIGAAWVLAFQKNRIAVDSILQQMRAAGGRATKENDQQLFDWENAIVCYDDTRVPEELLGVFEVLAKLRTEVSDSMSNHLRRFSELTGGPSFSTVAEARSWWESNKRAAKLVPNANPQLARSRRLTAHAADGALRS